MSPSAHESSHPDSLVELRRQNVRDTLTRIQRSLSLAYILSVLLFIAWFSSNFEHTELSDQISHLEGALEINSLKNWDDYFYEVSSCFDKFYFGFSGRLVSKEKLAEYIDHYSAENERLSRFVDRGQQGHYPIDRLRALLESDEHWYQCRFWAQRDSLVSFLFSLDYYLSRYFMQRWNALYGDGLDSFIDKYESINDVSDSTLVVLLATLDSLKKPFIYAVDVGRNPFVQFDDASISMRGRWQEFGDYSVYTINERIAILHRLNIITYFRSVFQCHKQLLEKVQPDLEGIVLSGTDGGSIRFSREETDITFFDLMSILRSDLWDVVDLPDSIQPKHILDLSLWNRRRSSSADLGQIRTFFPVFSEALEEYNLDRVSGIETLLEVLRSQRQFGSQKLQAFGAEISYNTVVLVLPGIVLGLCFLAMIFTLHLLRLFASPLGSGVAVSQAELTELMKAPVLLTMTPRWLGILLTVLPGLIASFVVFDQVGVVGFRSPFVSVSYCIIATSVIVAVLAILSFLCTRLPKVVPPSRDDGDHDYLEKPAGNAGEN